MNELPVDSEKQEAASPAAAARQGLGFLSCVLPCHNEAANIAVLLPQLRAALSALAPRWEIILVDDGSTDSTGTLIPAWTATPGIRAVQLSRNFGKEAALTAGLKAARGEAVITMDADLQHPVSLLPQMVAKWLGGADVVYTVRENRDDESWVKRTGARLFYKLLGSRGRFQVPADAGDFRLLDRAAVAALLSLPERSRFMKGLYAWVGFRAVPIAYTPAPRAHGDSSYGLLQLVALSLEGITSFTVWPLRAVSVAGFALAILGFAYGFYIAADYFFNGNLVSGWTTIVVGMTFYFGVLMISLGIVGEYVGRIFEEVKGRPLYLARSEWGVDSDGGNS
ncbi:MAG: glycosyltransferase family 2 protein [Burkholderiales bacterium]|nr:glycosyltransferase family 2 protein [Burkholderiales bacterium]